MRANVYIRKENEEAWHKLENKSEWVNSKLGGPDDSTETPSVVDRRRKSKLQRLQEKYPHIQFDESRLMFFDEVGGGWRDIDEFKDSH